MSVLTNDILNVSIQIYFEMWVMGISQGWLHNYSSVTTGPNQLINKCGDFKHNCITLVLWIIPEMTSFDVQFSGSPEAAEFFSYFIIDAIE